MFGSKQFRKIFLVRFLGFCFIQVGIITLILIIEPVFNEEAKYQIDQLLGRHHSLPKIITSAKNDSQTPNNNPEQNQIPQPPQETQTKSGFGDLLTGGSNIITPVSTDFGIVIEKINANAKVVPDVDPGNEKDYTRALAQGVAHARGTVYPGQKGNIYLFSHSVDAPWNIVRFNAIFYLLGKLESGDRIIMFYQGRRYDYIVFDKAIADPSDTHFLTDNYDKSVLTLQTCDPPGTLLHRLVIRAKLVGE
ncbi:MAG: sortase [Candidatus Daviesbacteria bacterium]